MVVRSGRAPAATREDALFQREADKFFTLLLRRKYIALPGEITHLEGHSNPDVALWLDPQRQQEASLAIRWALQLLRIKKDGAHPIAWNIVIPCHNYARYLGEAVESVCANDADYEIQIVDDASSDETPRVAASFVGQYPHIHYLRNEERRGTGYSRNRGIAARESDFVVLLDADDRIGPNYLFEAGRKLANGVDVVNPNAVLFGARQDRWNVPEGTTLAMLLEQNSVHCTSALRRQFWSQMDGFDEQIPFGRTTNSGSGWRRQAPKFRAFMAITSSTARTWARRPRPPPGFSRNCASTCAKSTRTCMRSSTRCARVTRFGSLSCDHKLFLP